MAIVAPHHIKYPRLTPLCVLAHNAWKASRKWVFLRSSPLVCICNQCYRSPRGIKGKSKPPSSAPYLLWYRRKRRYTLTFGQRYITRVSILRMLHLQSVYYNSTFFFFKLLRVLQYWQCLHPHSGIFVCVLQSMLYHLHHCHRTLIDSRSAASHMARLKDSPSPSCGHCLFCVAQPALAEEVAPTIPSFSANI